MLFEVRGLLKNALMAVGPLRRQLHRHLGKTGMNGSLEAAQKQLDFYTRHIQIAGKRVLELGPGHTPEVLLLASRAGAAQCVGLDVERLFSDSQLETSNVRVDLYDGRRMPYDDGSFDVVWSSDVLEHVRDPMLTLRECHRVLARGGFIAANIDLRDHYFLGEEERWLHCLAYPEFLWKAMTSRRSSFVNRWRASDWERALADLELETVVATKHSSDVLARLQREGRIRSHRGPMSDEDAATYRIDVVAQKR